MAKTLHFGGGGAKTVEEQGGETTFSPTNSSKEHLNAEQTAKTASDRWQRTPGAQRSSPSSSKGDGTKYKDKKRDKRARDGDPPGKGAVTEGVSKHQEALALAGLGEVFKSRRAT